MADADATELQGDGKPWGETTRKKRKRKRQDRVFFSFFSTKTEKWDGYERSEYEGKRSAAAR